MGLSLAGYRPDAFAARRMRLAKKIGEHAALIPAGGYVSRNFPAELYPYRASSHFLYLVGLPLVDGMLLVDGDGQHPDSHFEAEQADLDVD